MLMKLSKEVDETMKAMGIYGGVAENWVGKIKILENDQDKYWETQADINAGKYDGDCGTSKFWTMALYVLAFVALLVFFGVWTYLAVWR